MQIPWKRAPRPGAGPAATPRQGRAPGPAEPASTACGWFDSSDELRRGLDVHEAEEGSAPPMPPGLLRPPLVR